MRGVCIIGHGSSNDVAIFNGIRVAYEFAKAGTNERIEQELAGNSRRDGQPSSSPATLDAAHADPASDLASKPPSNPDAAVQ